MEKMVRNSNKIKRQIFIWSIIGGVLGATAGFLNVFGAPVHPIFPTSPAVITITGTMLGMVIGGIIGSLNNLRNKEQDFNTYAPSSKPLFHDGESDEKLQLREEQLTIVKNRIKTGAVNIHKEVIHEEKNITIPVTREELVIEKKDLHAKAKEIIRIPISEERIKITKHTEAINDVSIYKNKFQENKRVQETLKKEQVHLEVTGNPKIKKV